MTAITVNTATRDDIGSLVASVAALFREDAGRHDSLMDLGWPAREGTAYYSALVGDEACLVILARDGGHIAGHLIGKLSGPGPMLTGRIAVLESMRVAPGSRRTGVGSLLVRHFLTWARDRGAQRDRLRRQRRSAATVRAARLRARECHLAGHSLTHQPPASLASRTIR